MSNPIRIALIEDDQIFLEEMQNTIDIMLSSLFPCPYEIISFTHAEEFLTGIDTLRPDLLIADIDLGREDLTGIDLAGILQANSPDCRVIYLTAYLDFATDIFYTKPLYFILKTEYEARLPHAFSLFLKDYYSKQQVLSVVSRNIPTTIAIDSILYCEHVGKNTLIHTTNDVHPVRISIHQLLEKLPADAFSQCHKSFVVGMANISDYCQTSITLKSGDTVPISRSNLNRFREDYTRWLGTRI